MLNRTNSSTAGRMSVGSNTLKTVTLRTVGTAKASDTMIGKNTALKFDGSMSAAFPSVSTNVNNIVNCL